MTLPKGPPVRVLAIGGADPSGGAGIQADLQTLSVLGCSGGAVVTAITAQNASGVRWCRPVEADAVGEQLECALGDGGWDALKIGLVPTAPIVRALTDRLREIPLPLVLDPVMAPSRGADFLDPEAMDALWDELVPLATVVTPNLREAERRWGNRISDDATADRVAASLRAEGAVLLTGGHGPGNGAICDRLWDGQILQRIEHPRIQGDSPHGSGCVLAAAIAGGLAHGSDLRRSVEAAVDFVQEAIRGARIGAGGRRVSQPLWEFAG